VVLQHHTQQRYSTTSPKVFPQQQAEEKQEDGSWVFFIGQFMLSLLKNVTTINVTRN